MTLRARPVALIAFLIAAATLWGTPSPHRAAGSATGSPTGDEPGDPPEIDVLSVSPWVAPDGSFDVAFAVPATWPEGTEVTVTIHQRLRTDDQNLRTVAIDTLEGNPPTRNLQAPLGFELSELTNGTPTATLSVPIRSGSGSGERVLIPTAGIHPVDVSALDPDGEVLAESQLYLNRLPEQQLTGRDEMPARSAVQLLTGLDSPPALALDGGSGLSTEQSLAITPWKELIGSNLDLPLTTALRPDTLLALQRSADPLDTAFITGLSTATALTVAPQSFVRIDAAGLLDADAESLRGQVRLGESILGDLTGSAPTGPWILDDTVDEASASVLAELGVKSLIVSEDRIEIPGEDRDTGEGGDPSADLAAQRTLALADVPAMTVSTYDAPASRMLIDPTRTAALNAHRASTALVASWFDAIAEGPEAFPGVSAALLVSPSVQRGTLVALVDSLGGANAVLEGPAGQISGPLHVAGTPEPTHDSDGAPVTARLRDVDPNDMRGILRRQRQVTARINGFASMTPAAEDDTVEWRLLNEQSPATNGDAAQREATWAGIDALIDARLAEIDIPLRRNVVLTARRGSIPVRIRNGLDVGVRLRMTARSPRLEFPDGSTTEISLTPGENLIDVPVQVQAPGSSLLRIEFTSPDRSLVLPTTTVTVRSSSISGVGAALSAVSLAVLALWWIRTIRTRRHRPGDTAGTDHGDSVGQPDTDDPNDVAHVGSTDER